MNGADDGLARIVTHVIPASTLIQNARLTYLNADGGDLLRNPKPADVKKIDITHLNPEGDYINAIMMYETLTGESAAGFDHGTFDNHKEAFYHKLVDVTKAAGMKKLTYAYVEHDGATTYYDSLADAVAAAVNGDKLTILGMPKNDTELTIAAGVTVEIFGSSEDHTIVLTNGGNITENGLVAFAGCKVDDAEAEAKAIAVDPVTGARREVEIYEVTFVSDGETFTTQQVKHGATATEPDPAPTKAGYNLDGWYLNDEAFNFTTAIEGDIQLTAKWTARSNTPYTVEHYQEKLDGTYVLADTDNLEGTTDTEAVAAEKGYDDFTVDKTVEGTVASGNIAGDGSLVLKLYYTRNTYSYEVRHIKQLPDGTYDETHAEVENLSGKFEAIATVNAKDYGEHYPTNNAGTKQNIKIEKDLTIDVLYDLDMHTLTFDAKGGTETDSVTVRHGNTVAKPEDPKRSGYRFNGWFDDEKCREKHDFDAPLVEDATVHAGWTKRSSGSSVQIESPNKPKKDNSLKFNTEDHFAFVNGYPDGTVKPTGDVTRAEVAAILYRVMDADCVKTYETTRCSFSDVVRGDWFNLYVATLENAGVIVDTRTNGKFRPNEAITRAELAAMLAQFADIKSAANSFNDVSARHWASDEIAVCAKMGWINGYPDGSFRPDATITRAEMMAMINRALGRTPKSADDLLSGMKTWRDNANVNAWYYLDVQEATNSHTYTKSGSHESWKKLR